MSTNLPTLTLRSRSARPARSKTAAPHSFSFQVFTKNAACRAQALRAAFKIDVLTCDKCGGAKQVIAAIPPGAVATKILRHLGLPTQVVTKAEPSDIWRVRGPPDELLHTLTKRSTKVDKLIDEVGVGA